MITKINLYFREGPDVILLPTLQWNYEDQPNFGAEGFFIDLDLIHRAHPPLRDRMLYGLNRIAGHVITGVLDRHDYPIHCSNFENMLKKLYEMTTEDVVDVGQLNYDWLLNDAKQELSAHVQSFSLDNAGLNESVQQNMCVEET